MKIKTSELTDGALDWAVAKALGHNLKIRTWKDITDTLDPVEDEDMITFHRERNTVRVSAEQIPGGGWFPNPRYSTDWSQGGPIIEREKLSVGTRYTNDEIYHDADVLCWARNAIGGFLKYAPTPLIAAMRCFVASRLGDDVEVPDELCHMV